MRKSSRYLLLLAALLLGGCIVSDQLTTLTIHSDGSADLVLFRSNVRSMEKGERASKALAEYKANFSARVGEDFERIRQAGGEIQKNSWIRKRPPFSNFVLATFPDASVLERYFTVMSRDESLRVTAHFDRADATRSLKVDIKLGEKLAKESGRSDASSASAAAPTRQMMANAISETRIVVADGIITASSGFTVASDKRSALLDSDAVGELLSRHGKVQLLLEWQVVK